MFTGIIEETGTVVALKKEKSNLHISIKPSFLKEIKVDQSIAHNGVCLTVVEKKKDHYTVTAIAETLEKSDLKFLKLKDEINLERCMKADGRFDGHIVQGHVDCTAIVKAIEEQQGSWIYKFQVSTDKGNSASSGAGFQAQQLIVEKGSICINGVSLTVVDVVTNKNDVKKPGAKNSDTFFSVAIIPYTFHHTNFHTFKAGDFVNIEFDIIGKYIAKMLSNRSL